MTFPPLFLPSINRCLTIDFSVHWNKQRSLIRLPRFSCGRSWLSSDIIRSQTLLALHHYMTWSRSRFWMSTRFSNSEPWIRHLVIKFLFTELWEISIPGSVYSEDFTGHDVRSWALLGAARIANLLKFLYFVGHFIVYRSRIGQQ